MTTLTVRYTNYGYFYKASLNDAQITESELFSFIKKLVPNFNNQLQGMSIEHYLEKIQDKNIKIDFLEKDVT